MKREQLQTTIEDAFRAFQQPGCTDDLHSGGIDGQYVIKNYFGLTREQVAARHRQGSYYIEDFSYMQPAAVGYYLPAIMSYMMAHPDDDETWIYLGGYLAPRTNGRIWWNLEPLGVRAYRAIGAWAEGLAEEFVERDADLEAIRTADTIAKHYANAEPGRAPNAGSDDAPAASET